MLKVTPKILAVFLLPGTLLAQNHPGIGDELVQHAFHVDYAAFVDSLSDNIHIEVYYKMFSSALTYEKRGDMFKASYEVDLVINRKGKQVTGASRDGDLFADDYKMTLSTQDFVIDMVSFDLPPSDYELVGSLTDRFSGDEHNVKMDMKLRKFGFEIPSLSGIEFVREARISDGKSQFQKVGMIVIPSVSRVYGYDEPEMIIYYQIYNQSDFRGDYLAVYDIVQNDKSVRTDTSLFTSRIGVTERLERFSVESLLPGMCELSIQIKSPGSKLSISAAAGFVIGWSVLAIVKNDYKTAVDQLRYIASNEQREALLKASEKQHLELWQDFWKSMDPSPGTPANELRDEYYNRIRYTDLNFGIFGRGGWKTDMGMVYITYGPPDDIDRHPFDIDQKRYQIWYYYEEKLRFFFVDYNGYGDYELQYPYDGDARRLR